MDIHHGMREEQGNIKIVEALLDVSRKTARIGHQLADCLHLGALKRHSSCHDQADIARAEDDDLTAGHNALHIDVLLCRARGIDARRTCARNAERTLGTLAAAHCEDHGARLDLKDAHGGTSRHYGTVRAQLGDHRVGHIGDLSFLHHFCVAVGVFGSGQLLAEAVQAEAVMDALAQDAAERNVSFQNENVPLPHIVGGDGGGKACGTSADNDKLFFDLFHCNHPHFLV